MTAPHSDLPEWLGPDVRLYLKHTEDGVSLRALARADGRHASTLMRLVRRYERRREDPLLDQALAALARPQRGADLSFQPDPKEPAPMSAPLPPAPAAVDAQTLMREGRRVLRRLAEPGAVLAIAPDMEKALVLRDLPGGGSARLAVVDQAVAQAFVLQDWIRCRKAGRVSSYEISAAGRARLRDWLAAEPAPGLAEAAAGFAPAPGGWDEGARRPRAGLSESPVAVLGRRRDRDGQPFLAPRLIEAAERLREDFELSQMGPAVAQNWERFLTPVDSSPSAPDLPGPLAARNARDRVAAALRDLGPGLGDVVLRVCCYLEGIEATEERMGWAARSGKIVLRIALERLRRHQDETYGRHGPRIG